eukprot:NODE_279_length_3042_cov_29.500514_g242_i0.p1 GENE.NODE_279_length_3042_cov_29.500514_g242_i0~~NODE_279_length_3042_cov_29.500514_g242_i0.p1  ORF type:complete len:573 (-),score=129.72 NODE_279_length_3042_cov_29.500514_g242_i0:159-1877(-)
MAANGFVRTESCNEDPCPCVGEWSGWSECKCGVTTQSRKYTILKAASTGGQQCPYANNYVETQNCPLQQCPCIGTWGNWGDCSTSCGWGKQTRTYRIVQQGSPGTSPCSYPDMTTERKDCYSNCQSNPVNPSGPVDCSGYWTPWSECQVQCRGNGNGQNFGESTRIYTVTQFAANGGKACPAQNGQVERQYCKSKCNGGRDGDDDDRRQPVQPCRGGWTTWGDCSAACGPGTQSRTYRIVQQGTPKCEYPDLTVMSQNCIGTNCVTPKPSTPSINIPIVPALLAVDCAGYWTPWSSCQIECRPKDRGMKNGEITRIYTVTTRASNGGRACPAQNGQVESQDCKAKCGDDDDKDDRDDRDGRDYRDDKNKIKVVPCKGDWTTWGPCSTECGKGTQSRTYRISQPGNPACDYPDGSVMRQECVGNNCPRVVNNAPVANIINNTPVVNKIIAMPIDCAGYWTPWSDCRVECRGRGNGQNKGESTRIYTVTTQSSGGGKPCPASNGQVERTECKAKCELGDASVAHNQEKSGLVGISHGIEFLLTGIGALAVSLYVVLRFRRRTHTRDFIVPLVVD